MASWFRLVLSAASMRPLMAAAVAQSTAPPRRGAAAIASNSRSRFSSVSVLESANPLRIDLLGWRSRAEGGGRGGGTVEGCQVRGPGGGGGPEGPLISAPCAACSHLFKLGGIGNGAVGRTIHHGPQYCRQAQHTK